MNERLPKPSSAPTPFSAIGIDVGGTKIAAGLVTFPDATVRARCNLPTHPKRGGTAVLDDVFTLANDLSAQARSLGMRADAIGLGVCELVDPQGEVRSANCVAWKGVAVRDRLSKIAPTFVEADVRAAALSEALFGAGRGRRTFLYVTVGTGISCCLVLDGQPFTGAHGATGTMASSPLSVACEKCDAINDRTLEEIASGPALVARYMAQCPGAAQSGEDVSAAAAAGDRVAMEVVRSAGQALGAALGQLVNVLDPEVVVVGGGLGSSGGLYWDSLVESTRRHVWSDVHRELPLVPAVTGRDAGIIGAAAVAWKKA